MNAYNIFAAHYDALTENVNYEQRADYICRLLKQHEHTFGTTLDLACGTGSLTIALARKGVDIFGADQSCEMLSQAQMKAYEQDLNLLFLCQQMQELDLYSTIDTCLCTLDSINHIINKQDVQKTFDKVSLFMNKGGLFVFDVNTPYKNNVVLGNNTFVYDTPQVYCVWQNTIQQENIVDIDLDFFQQNLSGAYDRSSESFSERAYSHDEICMMLESAGLTLTGYYEELTFHKPKEDTQRIVYVAKK